MTTGGGGHRRKNSSGGASFVSDSGETVADGAESSSSGQHHQASSGFSAPSPLLLSPASAYTTYARQQQQRGRSRSPGAGEEGEEEYEMDDAHSRRTSITLAVPSGQQQQQQPTSPGGGSVSGVSHVSTRVGEEEGEDKDLEGAKEEKEKHASTSLFARLGLKRTSAHSNDNDSTNHPAAPSRTSTAHSQQQDTFDFNDDEEHDPHALLVRMQEADARADPAPFPRALAPLALAKLVDPKSVESLREMGGHAGRAKGPGDLERVGGERGGQEGRAERG